MASSSLLGSVHKVPHELTSVDKIEGRKQLQV